MQHYNDVFDNLLQEFRDRVAVDTLVVVHRIWEDLTPKVDDLRESFSKYMLSHQPHILHAGDAVDLNSMPYARGAGLNMQQLCLEGTRENLLEEISDWINNVEKDASRIFWLHGSAGTGKSSIAHTIAHRFLQLERLGSCFSFDRSRMAERRHEKVFSTIARDLANHDMSLRRQLAAVIRDNDALKNTTDILQQWEELIMKPVGTFSGAIMGPIVIIIDALDESGDTDSRRVLLRILANTESRITDLPPNIRILLTSRDLPDIAVAFKGRMHIREKSLDSIPPDSTERDILRYVSDELSLVDFGIPSQEVFASLARSSGQIFEWARLACAYIRGDNDAGSGMEPQERFDAIINHSKTDHVPFLDGMYKFTLEAIYPKDQPQGQRDLRLKAFKSVMAQILGTREPLSLGSLTSMRSHFKNLAEIDIRTIVAPLAALLSGTTEPTTEPSVPLRFFHVSFADFLTDRNRSGEFSIHVHLIHNDLAFASLAIMMEKLRFNICDLPSSYLPNSAIHDLDNRIKECIPPELAYSCRFWMEHVRQAPFNPPLAAEVRAFVNNERLLFWFEVLSLLKLINTCAGSLSSLIQWAMVCRMNDLLHRIYILTWTTGSPMQSIRTSPTRQRMPKDSFVRLVAQFLQAPLTCTCLRYHFRRRKHILPSLQTSFMDCRKLSLDTEQRGRRFRVRYMGTLGL